MHLVHLDPVRFTQLIERGIFVMPERVELAKDEIVLMTAPEDYPTYPFQVIMAARFRDWAPLATRVTGGQQRWVFVPNAWWILAKPFLMQEVALAGRRYHTGSTIVPVHGADETIIRQRGIEATGPLQNPGPYEPPLRTIDENRIAELFHALWGRDTTSPDYDKGQWSELQFLLREQGVRF